MDQAKGAEHQVKHLQCDWNIWLQDKKHSTSNAYLKIKVIKVPSFLGIGSAPFLLISVINGYIALSCLKLVPASAFLGVEGRYAYSSQGFRCFVGSKESGITIKFSRETRRTLLGVSAVFLALMISCRLEYCR